MKRNLTIALSALLLSGCIAEWKNPHGPQRWSGTPYSSQSETFNPTPPVNPESHSGPGGPRP
jgi:hypothetical protein